MAQTGNNLPASYEAWGPGSSGGSSDPLAPAAAPPAAVVPSLDSMYGNEVSPVLLLAGLLVLSVVLSTGKWQGCSRRHLRLSTLLGRCLPDRGANITQRFSTAVRTPSTQLYALQSASWPQNVEAASRSFARRGPLQAVLPATPASATAMAC